MKYDTNQMMPLVVVGVIVLTLLYWALAVAAFLLVVTASFFTGVALRAWFHPVEIFGEEMTPDEARALVIRGVAAFALVAGFLLWRSHHDGVPFDRQACIYFGAIAYSLAVLFGEESPEALPPAPQQQPEVPPPSIQILPPPARPFHYASWNDEEEFR